MRYVIVIVGVTLFIGWEAIYSNWMVTRSVVAEVSRVSARLGL